LPELRWEENATNIFSPRWMFCKSTHYSNYE
jgi:hypothetical protein